MREEDVAERVQLVQRRRQIVGVADHRVDLVLQDLGVEQLLAVFPLVQRLGLVQAFVALHADQRQFQPGRDRLRQFGLADAGRAFHQDRLLQMMRHVDRGRDLAVGDISGLAQALFDSIDRSQGQRPPAAAHHSHPAPSYCSVTRIASLRRNVKRKRADDGRLDYNSITPPRSPLVTASARLVASSLRNRASSGISRCGPRCPAVAPSPCC